MGKTLRPAIFKIVQGEGNNNYTNKDAVEKLIGYVLREDGRLQDDLWGSIGIFHKSKEGIIKDFKKVKKLYHKEDGVLVKHLLLSWGKRPALKRKKMRILIKHTLSYWSKDYQVVYAVHEDKGPDQYHMHIVLNSVSHKGKKIQIWRKELCEFQRKFNNIWNPYGYMLEM